MTRLCENCGFENQDEYDYCAKCGNPLVEGMPRKQFYVYKRRESPINKKAILLAYIVTIFLSWSGVVFALISKSTRMAVFTFFGFFLPFYLVQAPSRELRKHGFIMLAISAVGICLSMYMIMN